MPSQAAPLYYPKSLRNALLFSLIVAGLVACSSEDNEASGEGGGGSEGGQPTPGVTVATVETQNVEVRQDYAGRAQGAREVEVRARVQGILEERLYQEGQLVEEGESLFRIDQKPSEAMVGSARAEQRVAEADLRQAEREWNRISSLYERNAVSERDRDTAQSDLELAEANLAVAQAAVIQSELDLGYTDVQAPVSGVTSLEDLPEGSLVEVGTLLTTIVQQDPIHVRFALPEDDASIQRTARRAMTGDEEGQSISAILIRADGSTYDQEGEVDFTASTLDSRTGSVSARAVFPNEESDIIPGQFVRVRVTLQDLKDVVTIPEDVVSEGAEGAQVFIVEDNKAIARQVELGPVVDGRQVILEGLSEGDKLVVNGHVSLQNGVDVDVTDDEGASDSGDGESN
ncbi:efflux RND transporter periplasmic adaptor subunit [Marinobacter sp. HL-58]|uniref:efflux RND transporter periplasmic adaptor subunit n=1 Tax=Marinobacter sp. HL-58 TaxID=1479237 RepID=UPI00048760B8|nr:efflux RND transporter periplasmic adaptor subunit [Marinobacter sp. HL-58]KPQ02954.1 MAG: RND-type efflux system membrane fusion component AcrA [Marinobacter sp. HL-58]